jgi:DNA-binding transcriptional regulator YiaG
MQTAQQFGAASSYGKKYALGNLFLIDDTQDADANNDHGKKSNVVNKIKKAALKPITDEQMKKAKEYIIAGGVVEPIRQKYKLTDKQFKELVEVQKKN